jgi:phytoene dehydrogenase-like protein
MHGRAVVIGSGPNGLSAAILLAQSGLDVEVREAAATPGGGVRSGEVTLPGFVHDLGSAVHPMALSSPFLSTLPLREHGLEWIWPDAQLAHPLDDGTAVLLERDVQRTAAQFDSADAAAYRKLFQPLVKHWGTLTRELLRPVVRIPRHPFLLARFGLKGMQPATLLARSSFGNSPARALFAGSAAHSFLKLEAPISSAFGLMLSTAGHAVGWPIPKGGSQQITNALAGVLRSYGGRILTDAPVEALDELGSPDLTLCDVTPRQFIRLADRQLRGRPFLQLLERYRYGPGVFKVDWALREPIPWTAKECLRAATVHLGGTLEEIAASERGPWQGKPSDRPFVLLVQPSLFDSTRAPAGQHTAWAYCHVPNGWTGSMLPQIEGQIERFAPGFRDCVLARAVWSPADLERSNQNLIGGDINGGAVNLGQFFIRPTWRLYGTPLHGVYLCSSSTPPGGAVHGMCGYNAARRALKWLKARRRT